MGREEDGWVQEVNTRHKIEDMRLKKTKQAIDCYKQAKIRNFAPNLIQEIAKLIEDCAKYEWGKDTMVEIQEHKIIIEDWTRREEIEY